MKDIVSKRNIFLLIIAALLLAAVLNISGLVGFFSWIYNAFSALIIGGCIAFVLNLLVDLFSHKVFWAITNPKRRTLLSLIVSIVVLLLLLLLLVFIIIPQLIDTFRLIGEKLPGVLDDIQRYALYLTQRFPAISEKLAEVKASKTPLSANFTHFLKTEIPEALSHTFIIARQTFRGITTVFIAIMISIYIILSKRQLARQAREFCYGTMSKDWARKTLYIAHLTANDFKAFIKGRVVDALLMAGAYLILALIFRLPYTPMIASIIAVFSIIPLFGALISWGLGFFLIITVSFWQAVIFSVLILVIFFITRNFIYPRLIANSVGLPDLWVLIAVVIGGKLFGLIGMLTGVPIFSVIYRLTALSVHQELNKKKVPESDLTEQPDWQHYDALTNSFDDERN